MAHSVRIHTGNTNVQLPDGGHHNAGDVVILTDDQYARINQADFSSNGAGGGALLDDLGVVASSGDAVVTQAAFVAAPAALTAAAVATANAATQTGSYVQADAQSIAALANANKAAINALVTDITALRTTVANLLTALKATGGPMASA